MGTRSSSRNGRTDVIPAGRIMIEPDWGATPTERSETAGGTAPNVETRRMRAFPASATRNPPPGAGVTPAGDESAVAAAREKLGERLERFSDWAREAGLAGEMRMPPRACRAPRVTPAWRCSSPMRPRNALRSPAADLSAAGELSLRGRESPVVVWTPAG
jgi:hypothetical protein